MNRVELYMKSRTRIDSITFESKKYPDQNLIKGIEQTIEIPSLYVETS
jgi:hypothetical protein